MAQPTWNTPAGTIGTFPSDVSMVYQLSAVPELPATSLTYTLLAGTLPTNIVLNTTTGLLSGIPTLVTQEVTTTFAIRVTDNLNNISDRTFSITISGIAVPLFTTPSGILLSTQDSVWTQIQVNYSNPDPTNIVGVELQEGLLPPGLELSSSGLIQGYPAPPTTTITLPLIETISFSTTSQNSYIYCKNVAGVTVGRTVTFTNPIGNLSAGVTYYVKSINATLNTFTISATQNGGTLQLIDASGGMTVTFPALQIGQPTIRTYNFVLRLFSPLGGNVSSYSITVINQNVPISQGGPGNPPNTRRPTLLNTRPLNINPTDADPYYGYYILPPVLPTQNADLGTFESNNFFAFKMIGHDFDDNQITYGFSNLPSWLTGNVNTGWITGNPYLSLPGLNRYNFNVSVYKTNIPSIASATFSFAFNLSNEITGKVVWYSSSNLGTVLNETVSTLSISAESDVELEYRVIEGALPPNLQLLSNGEITGYIASQPTSTFLESGTVTDFTFTVEAFSSQYPVITSIKTFTISVLQEFSQPTDVLYIKATPSINDRNIIASLLNDENLIPTTSLYRPDDGYFGKASSVIYQHAFGIYASSLEEYLASITQSHYWRNITLGEIKTAVAKNDLGEIIYEVVYSEVIDDLINPKGQSVPNSIYWPVPINLFLGPWYTSVTDVFTSYVELQNQKYFTSLDPGYARTLYPNSLYNMRNRVSNVLGQEFDSRLLPLWMTSQQPNGSTLGYTQAWVICYTKPGKASEVKTNIQTKWPYTLNQINFQIDRFSVDKNATYNWDNNLIPPTWTGLPSANPVPDPADSKDFYVLFPRKTILPDETQY